MHVAATHRGTRATADAAEHGPVRVTVAVIGGGVAGAAAACGLAELGMQVVLFEPRLDAQRPVRAKCCGHCLNRRAMRAFARLGLDGTVRGAASGELHAAVIEVGGARAEVGSRGLAVRRDALDPALLDEARARGVAVRPCAARIEGVDGGVVASDGTRVAAQLVVGADGIASRVARDAGLVVPGDQGRRFGVSFDLPASVPEVAALVAPGAVRMSFIGGGYLGFVRQGALVHAGLLFDAGVSPAQAFGRFAEAHADLARVPRALVAEALAAAGGAGPIPFIVRGCARGRIALVGDAAGYVEPLSGEGMTWAVESAAALVEAARRVEPARIPGEYARIRAGMHRSFGRVRLLAAIAARPRLARLAVRGAALAPRALRDAIGALIA